MERGHVINGHVDNNEFVPKSRHFARSSTPERPPPLSRTDLLREVLPGAVPDGRTLGSKQIRHIARDENLCFTCLKPGHTRVECPTDPRFSTSPHRRVSETLVSGLQIQVPSGKKTNRSFDNESWDDPPPVSKRPATSVRVGPFPSLMSLAAERPKTNIQEKALILEKLRTEALDSLNDLHRPSRTVEQEKNSSVPCTSTNTPVSVRSSSHMSSDTPGSASVYLPSKVDPKLLLLTTVSKPIRLVPTRREFDRRNDLYYSDDEEGLSDRDRYPLGTFPLSEEEAASLTTYRRDRRIWWTEPCEFDETSYKYVPPNPPISTADPYWSYKEGL